LYIALSLVWYFLSGIGTIFFLQVIFFSVHLITETIVELLLHIFAVQQTPALYLQSTQTSLLWHDANVSESSCSRSEFWVIETSMFYISQPQLLFRTGQSALCTSVHEHLYLWIYLLILTHVSGKYFKMLPFLSETLILSGIGWISTCPFFPFVNSDTFIKMNW